MTLTELFTQIADAIRAKLNSTDKIVASDFPSKIEEITGGGSADTGEYNTALITDGSGMGTSTGVSTHPYCLHKLIKKLPSKMSIGFTGNLDHFFYYCDKVTEFPELVQELSSGGKPRDITNVPSMFQECSKLIKPPYFDTSNVINASNMFTNDKELIELPNYNFSNCTKFTEFLYSCEKIQDISNLIFGQPVSVTGMLRGCTSLEYIPQIDFSKVTSLSYTFYGCSNLKTDLALDLSSCTVLQYAFQGCGKNTNNKITLTNTSKVYDWRYAFSGSTGNVEPIPDMSACTQIESMFSGNTNIETLPINSVGNATNIYCLCYNCTSLTSFPELDTSKVTKFQRFLHNCSALVSVPVLNMSATSGGSNIQQMYEGCTSLSDESLNNIMASLLTAVKITNTTYKNLKYIGLSQEQAEKCKTLSNYQAFIDAGWLTGF